MVKLFACFVFLIVFNCFAGNYLAIIDAGSSGSRIYMYLINDGSSVLQSVELPGKTKVKPGIDKTENISRHLESLVDCVKAAKIDCSEVTFYLMATAGMRTVSPIIQKKVYCDVKKYFESLDYTLGYVGTIPGEYEAAFEWLAVNYLKGTLDKKVSSNMLSMGGASAQIAYRTKNSNHRTIEEIKIHGSDSIFIYAKSYLGLGSNLARSQFYDKPSCWNKGYPLPNGYKGEGNLIDAIKLFDIVVNDIQKVNLDFKNNEDIYENKEFVGISGFNNTITADCLFGKSKLGVGVKYNQLLFAVNSLGQRNWDEISQKDWGFEQDFIQDYYINSVCILSILNAINFDKHDIELKAIQKINDIEASWTLGAGVFFANGNEIQKVVEQEKSQSSSLEPAA
jgi:hypothetical protein